MSEALLSARGLEAERAVEGRTLRVLRGVDVDVARSELLDVSGPSGSGKTTLLLALARMMPGSRGRLELSGRPAEQFTPALWRSRVAYVPQRHAVFDGSVRDNLLLPFRLKVRSAARPPDDLALQQAMAETGLEEVALDREAAKLSVGQAARVGLLRVMLTSPDVMLLDEPDASLDDASAEAVNSMIARFVAGGGGAVRVRHARKDDLAQRRFRLSDGVLEEV